MNNWILFFQKPKQKVLLVTILKLLFQSKILITIQRLIGGGGSSNLINSLSYASEASTTWRTCTTRYIHKTFRGVYIQEHFLYYSRVFVHIIRNRCIPKALRAAAAAVRFSGVARVTKAERRRAQSGLSK